MKKKSNIEAVKNRLLERKKELEQEILEKDRFYGTDRTVKDVGDEIFSSIHEAIELSLYNTEWEELAHLNKALDLINSGDYGICQECAKPISDKRLNVYPDATLCLACQEVAETQ